MGQTKMTKKSGQHHRSTKFDRTQKPSAPHHEEGAPVTSINSEEQRDLTPDSVPELVARPQAETPAPADRKPTPLALIPRQFPAVYEGQKRVVADAAPELRGRFSTLVKALLLSGALTAGLILTLGALNPNRNNTLPQAGTSLALAVPTSEASTGQNSASTTTPLDKGTDVKRANRVASKSTAPSGKSNSSNARAGKKDDNAKVVRSSAPVADNAKKKTTSTTIAKAPKKTLDTPAVPSDGQNNMILASKSPDSQNKYAQCQERGNFLRREQCKWQVCNGKWGQDGCPSYASDSREFN